MSSTRNVFSLYFEHFRRYPRYMAIILLTVPFAVFAGSFGTPYVASRVIDTLSKNPQTPFQHFIPYIVIAAIFALINAVSWRIIVGYVWRFDLNVERDIAERVFSHLSHQSERFHSNNFGGGLVASTNRLVMGSERLWDEWTYSIYPLLLSFIFTIIILAPRAPLYVAILVVVTTLAIITLVLLRGGEITLSAAAAKAKSRQTSQLADSITNITTMRSFGQEAHEAKLFKKRTDDLVNRELSLSRMVQRNEYIGSIFSESMNVLSIVIAIIVVTRFNGPIGTVLLITSYTSNLLGRLWSLQNTLKGLNQAIGDAQEMTELLHQKPAITDVSDPKPLSAQAGVISFENVSFRYEEGANELFKDLSFTISSGQRVGLVGPSGGGKSTITKLLLRFADVTSGRITIDGTTITEVAQSDLRQHIAYVPQEPLLFHRSLADNIRYGNLNATDEELRAAAAKARATEFIDLLPKGYDTMVGERGIKLSGGQRQRIAIARAILKDAPILILDEATSALDSHSEHLIQQALHELMVGRTTLVIAHRLSTISELDRVIVLESGAIIEDGTHTELLKQKGLYASLWAHQSGGFIEDEIDDIDTESADSK